MYLGLGHGTCLTRVPTHAPRFLSWWRDLLPRASHLYSCCLVSALPLSHFVPKVSDKEDEAHWSENKNRIGREVRRDGQESVPPHPELFSEYQSRSSHCPSRFELGVTDSCLVTMSRKLENEINNRRAQSYAVWQEEPGSQSGFISRIEGGVPVCGYMSQSIPSLLLLFLPPVWTEFSDNLKFKQSRMKHFIKNIFSCDK